MAFSGLEKLTLVKDKAKIRQRARPAEPVFHPNDMV